MSNLAEVKRQQTMQLRKLQFQQATADSRFNLEMEKLEEELSALRVAKEKQILQMNIIKRSAQSDVNKTGDGNNDGLDGSAGSGSGGLDGRQRGLSGGVQSGNDPQRVKLSIGSEGVNFEPVGVGGGGGTTSGGNAHQQRRRCESLLDRLVTLEQAYTEVLDSLVRGIRKPVHDRNLLSEQREREIFINCGEIQRMHLELLSNLEDARVDRNLSEHPEDILTNCFLEIMPFFQRYFEFADGYLLSSLTLQRARKENMRFALFLESDSGAVAGAADGDDIDDIGHDDGVDAAVWRSQRTKSTGTSATGNAKRVANRWHLAANTAVLESRRSHAGTAGGGTRTSAAPSISAVVARKNAFFGIAPFRRHHKACGDREVLAHAPALG